MDLPKNKAADDDVATIKEAFDLFDKDSDGTIELSELKAVMNDLGRSVSDEELEGMMNDVDVDGNGSIDFEEFCEMLTKIPEKSHDEILLEAFKVFDIDGNGVISRQELKETMLKLDSSLTDAHI